MSRVEQIQGDVKSLSPEEFSAFREWFVEFDAEIWDRQLESDVRVGKLNSLAKRALCEQASGRSVEL